MATLRPQTLTALSAHRREAIRLAKAQEKAVIDKCLRSGEKPPGYTFDELIGKGSFGRVYKGRQNATNRVVAVKVLDIDEADFQAFGDMKDEQLRDFNKEIQILRKAQESGASNLNQMIEALSVHSQLWLICEYCPGGSVKTLMRATKDRLEDRYFIVVARELAKALSGLHQAGIMHRDVKAANVLIHENGSIQLCDFGIAAALEGQGDKRRTFVGTLHWMPPELWADKPEYSDEVDVWGYGCTLYECAVGLPPNSDVRNTQQLKMRMRRLKQSIGLPDDQNFAHGMRDLVKYALNPDAASRPSMDDILQHDYLVGTEQTHPTSMLVDLVQVYYAWLFGGGQRVSLFMPGGAVAASEVDTELVPNDNIDEWNFSMTQDFERRMSAVFDLDPPDLSSVLSDGDVTPRAVPQHLQLSPPSSLSATERANFDLRVKRGAGLEGIFDGSKPAYEYKAKTDFVPIQEPPTRRASDLPLRAMVESRPFSTASVTLDLGDFDSDDYASATPSLPSGSIQTTYAEAVPKAQEPVFVLPDAATIRAKRADSRESRGSSRRDRSSSKGTRKFSDPMDRSRSLQRNSIVETDTNITPVQQITSHKSRDTMGWTFADAMSSVDAGGETIKATASSLDLIFNDPSPDAQRRAVKHATMEWSFTSAMAQAEEEEIHSDGEQQANQHSRPTPLLRTMTMPTTFGEMNDVYDDWSRPSTSMSGTYSESSLSSDNDPFNLQSIDEDGPGGAEIEDDSGFYQGHSSRPLSRNGNAKSDLAINSKIANAHLNDIRDQSANHQKNSSGDSDLYMRSASQNRSPLSAQFKSSRGQRSPRTLGHIRGNGSGASRVSEGSSSSTRMSNNLFGGASTSNGSGSSGTGLTSCSGRSLPQSQPPCFEVMSGDASPTTLERELGRLLEEFHDALHMVGEVVGDTTRGRTMQRVENGGEWDEET